MKLDTLINTGVLQLNKPTIQQREKTIIVLGAARGGTTMVASVLKTLGVFMGNKIGTVIEDVEISSAVETGNSVLMKELVVNRNKNYPIWGWKRPSAIKYYPFWKDSFRNPYIIAIFRDPFAVANRNRISVLADIYQNMNSTLDDLNMMVSIIKDTNAPVLLCSYEKVLLSPEDFVHSVDNFLDLNVPKQIIEAGVDVIKPAPKEYLENSRITNSLGFIETLNEEFCSGWVFYPKTPQRVVHVEIFYNGQLYDSTEAKLLRTGLKNNGIHPTGLCGFKYFWPIDRKPSDLKLIQIKAKGDIKPINFRKTIP